MLELKSSIPEVSTPSVMQILPGETVFFGALGDEPKPVTFETVTFSRVSDGAETVVYEILDKPTRKVFIRLSRRLR